MSPDEEITIRYKVRDLQTLLASNAAAASSIDKVSNSTERANKNLRQTNSHLSFLYNLTRVIRPVAIVTGIGALAQVTAALGGGAVAAVSGLSPLVGLLASAGPLAAAAATGFGVLGFSFMGLKKALGGPGGLGEDLDIDALAKLPPATRAFAQELQDLKPSIIDLQSLIGEQLFPGISAGMHAALTQLDIFKTALPGIAGEIGSIAKDFGQYLARADVGADIAETFRHISIWTRQAGQGGIALADAFRNIFMAALPMTDELVRMALQFALLIQDWAATNRANGNFQRFFEESVKVLKVVIAILANLAMGLLNVGKAAYPLGQDILHQTLKLSEAFREWTESAKGQNTMAKYFRDIRPTLAAVAKLVLAIGGYFLKLGQDQNIAPLIDEIRTQLLPLLYELFTGTNNALGPAFVQLIHSVLQLLVQLTGPFELFIKFLSQWAQLLALIIDHVPGLYEILTVLAAIAAMRKIVTFTLLVTGMSTLVGWIGRVVAAQKAFAVANGVSLASSVRLRAVIIANQIGYIGLTAAIWLADVATWAWNGALIVLEGLLAILLSPIILVILAIVALIAIIVLLATNAFGVRDKVISAFNAVVDFFSGLGSTIANIGKTMWNGILDGFKAVINAIIKIWNDLSLHVGIPKKIFGVSIPGGGHGFTLDTPDIPFLASGGYITSPGSVVVGEAGPELLNLPAGASVHPLEARPSYASQNPGMNLATGSDGYIRLENHNHVYLDGREISYSVTSHAEDEAARM